MSLQLTLDHYLALGFVIVVVIVPGLLLLNWIFPLLESRTADELHAEGRMPIVTAGRARITPPPMVGHAAAVQRRSPLAPDVQRRYWRAHLWLIGALLAVWLAGSIAPALLASTLDRVQFGGFPLSYYLGAQTSLLLFVVLIVAYSFFAGRLERSYGGAAVATGAHRGQRRRVLGLTAGFGGLLFVLEQLEVRAGVPPVLVGWTLLIVTLAAYIVIGLRSRSHTIGEYYVAGRRIAPLFNGMAISADWMSAATFIALAGALWRLGFEGLAYIMGWTGGYVLVALLIAPYLRRFGQFTVPDFFGARYGSAARIVAAILGILISFTYLTAQVTGVGIIMSRFLGVSYVLGVVIGISAVLFCSFVGGMQAITWTQVAQCVVMLIAYLVPVAWLAFRVTGVPLPQLMYGQALRDIAMLEARAGITNAYTTPFNDWTPWNFGALTLCLMMGTAGLPHLLTRCYTTPSVHATRRSIGWGIVFIVLLYSAIPAYAAFARREMLLGVIGQPLARIPQWTVSWEQRGYLSITDRNADKIVQPDELAITEDMIVLATPEMAGLPQTMVALVAVGGLAAALSTADGLLLVIASATAHDLYFRTFSPRAGPRKRLLVARGMVLVAALLAALTAIRQLAIIVQLVAWAFSLAAATIFPALVLGIFWKRTTSAGAVAGMLCGLLVTLSYMIAVFLDSELAVLGIGHVAAGIWGVPVNIVVTWLVSMLTTSPSANVRQLVDWIRSPEQP